MNLLELQDVFAIQHGTKLDLNKMEASTGARGVAFIGRSGEGNGIVAFVKTIVELPPYPAGLITVALGGIALSSFVQPWPFYTAQNIDVLRPHKDDMSLDVKLYYCRCIEANRFRYSTFGREANRTLRKLLVPAPDEIPAWVHGATARAIEELRRDLASVAAATTSN